MVLLGSSFCFGLTNPTSNLDFLFPGYFIRIPFPWHDYMFYSVLCGLFYGKHHRNVDASACTRPLFPLLRQGVVTAICSVLPAATAIKVKSRDQAHRRVTIKGSRWRSGRKYDQNQNKMPDVVYTLHTLKL